MYYIVGKGKTAMSVVRYCQRRNIAHQQVDTWLPPAQAVDRIIVSPGIDPKPQIIPYARQHNIPLTNDIGLFVEQSQVPRIVITGSNGKSTVVTLLAEMLRAAGYIADAIGNIGRPVLDYVDRDDMDYVVMEVSSFQLEVLESIPCEVAYVTNLSHDHLDRHGDMNAYAHEKAKVYRDCAIAVINQDDPYCRVMPTGNAQRIIISSQDRLSVSLKMVGEHNRLNALACWVMSSALGIKTCSVQAVMEQFSGLPHRCQCVQQARGVAWYDDSKATNVASTLVAINSFASNNIILLLGGRGKGQDFSSLKPVIARYVKMVILLGEERYSLDHLLREVVHTQIVDTLQEAVNVAGRQAQPGDIVLLSPACSSLDMFEHFEQRGHLFLAAIRNFLHESA